MKIISFIAAGAVALLSMTSLAWAEGGTPLSGIPVGLEGEPGGIAAGKGKTDARGNVTFKDLKPGRYAVKVECCTSSTVPAAQFLIVSTSVNGTLQSRREFPIGSSVGTLTVSSAKDIVTLNLESKAVIGGIVIAPPKAISPAHGAVVGGADPKAPVALRWTPLIPKPTEPVTYRLRVWQLMQGQIGTQAMKANQPIFTKDVDNITQTFAVPDCRQKACSFVWTIQALNRDGKPIGGNNGTSDPFDFTIPGAAGDNKR